MSDRKNIGNISFHNDDETGMSYIGEPDGGFIDSALEDYLKSFGSKGRDDLLAHLGYMSYKVIETYNRTKNISHDAQTASIGDITFD